jgi:hypothetical protein
MTGRTTLRPRDARATAATGLHIEPLDAAGRAAFPHEPFLVRHDLVGHPLLTLEGIVGLVERLPARHVDWHVGDVTLDHEGRPPKPPADPRQMLREIETAGAWLGIDKAQVDPACRELVEACVADVAHGFPGRLRDLHLLEGNVFVSSPGARKPLHMDPEHNFLLQIRGTKTVHVWDGRDRTLVPETMLEEFATTTDWAGVPVRRDGRAPTRSFHLEPGTGLYFPVQWPHAVENGTEVASTSFSVTFRSAQSRRAETIRQFNAKWRRRGRSPRPPGTSALADGLKVLAMRTARGLKRLLRKAG